MSAFAYQDPPPPFLVDTVFNEPNTAAMAGTEPNGEMEEGERRLGLPCFPQFYPSASDHRHRFMPSTVDAGDPEHAAGLEASAVAAGNHAAADSSSVLQMDGLESGKQATQMLAFSGDWKKDRDSHASSLTFRDGGEAKRQRKCCGGDAVKGDGERRKQGGGEEAEDRAPKGYVHVRARRGQATDSHSLAERARRERISERMKVLQSLVPGCDKVTGKALMLDEIINYVQSLQNQVEILSMKLASLNPMLYTNFLIDFDASLFGTEQCSSSQQPTAFSDAAPAYSTASTYPLLDTSSSSLLLQDTADMFWEGDELGQKVFHQAVFNPNLYSFH